MNIRETIEIAVRERLKSIANNAGMIGNVARGMEDDLTREGLNLMLEKVGQIRPDISTLYEVIKLAEDVNKNED